MRIVGRGMMGSEAMADGGASGVAMAGGGEEVVDRLLVVVFVFVEGLRFVMLCCAGNCCYLGGMDDRRGVG